MTSSKRNITIFGWYLCVSIHYNSKSLRDLLTEMRVMQVARLSTNLRSILGVTLFVCDIITRSPLVWASFGLLATFMLFAQLSVWTFHMQHSAFYCHQISWKVSLFHFLVPYDTQNSRRRYILQIISFLSISFDLKSTKLYTGKILHWERNKFNPSPKSLWLNPLLASLRWLSADYFLILWFI